jgi:hypothetical protein
VNGVLAVRHQYSFFELGLAEFKNPDGQAQLQPEFFKDVRSRAQDGFALLLTSPEIHGRAVFHLGSFEEIVEHHDAAERRRKSGN